jgi:signal transduction histidine kinase
MPEVVQNGTLLLDGDDRIVCSNKTIATMLRVNQPLKGMHLTELPSHAHLIELTALIRESGEPQSIESTFPPPYDVTYISGFPYRDNEKAPANSILLIITDMTRLRQLEQAGEEYANNVSHELKTPLTVILGYTETLLSHSSMPKDARQDALKHIERNTLRITRIIDDLLHLAWLKNERKTAARLSRPFTSVEQIVENAVDSCRLWAKDPDIGIITDIQKNLHWNLNAGLMEEAVLNLLKNAMLYALTSPVGVKAFVMDNGNLAIRVSDSGPGLYPEDAQHIFDRFYRADRSRSRSSAGIGGSGLGLPIVHQILEAHDGIARVETSPGNGCTFVLEIPPLKSMTP